MGVNGVGTSQTRRTPTQPVFVCVYVYLLSMCMSVSMCVYVYVCLCVSFCVCVYQTLELRHHGLRDGQTRECFITGQPGCTGCPGRTRDLDTELRLVITAIIMTGIGDYGNSDDGDYG